VKLSPSPKVVGFEGAEAALGELFRGVRRVVLVTGPHVSRLDGFERLRRMCASDGREVFVWDGSRSDPTLALVRKVGAFARARRAQAVVGVGGGSPLDTAKMVAALLAHEGDVESFLGQDAIPGPCVPLVAVPTTAGTGSEVTNIAILTDEVDRIKKAAISDHLVPDLAILAPELTVGLPPGTTAATAMDALCHASEAYLSRRRNALSDGLALAAVRTIARTLPRVMADPDDLAARRDLLEASLMAGLAFNNASVTAIHAFAYPLGGRYHLAHGLANSLMFAPVMRHNLSSEPERFADLAEAFGGTRDPHAWVEAVETLRRALPLPRDLAEAGVLEADLEPMADDVMTVARLLAVNPREITRADAGRIYREAWTGARAEPGS